MKADKSGNMQKILALLLAAAMLFSLSAAAFADEAEIDYTTGTPWLCSFLETNITPDTPKPDLADDFFLACNLEALQELEIPDGYNRYGTQEAVAVRTLEDVKTSSLSAPPARRGLLSGRHIPSCSFCRDAITNPGRSRRSCSCESSCR